MPRDRHPRARQAKALARKQGKRRPYERILIVCEGSKTEPLYLSDIRKQQRIPTAHIHVVPSSLGTEPRQVVDCAEATFREMRNFDSVFTVFDRDEHLTYADALTRAAQIDNTLKNDDNKLVRFQAVVSVPCFELWILLHYQDVHAFWHRDNVISAVAGPDCLPGYRKGSENVYTRTERQLPDATRRAEYLRQQFNPFTGTDPYTDMDWLVGKLRSLAKL